MIDSYGNETWVYNDRLVLYDIGSAIAYKINGDEQHAGCTGENIGWGCTTPSEILAGSR